MQQQGTPTTEPSTGAGARLPHVRVFVVDDVEQLRVLARFQLEEDPALRVVGEAADGAGALAGIEEAQPDVVVLDLALPGLDGLELIPLIHECSPTTRIVVFSGFGAERLEQPALERGACAYVEKGASPEVLRKKVRAAGAMDG